VSRLAPALLLLVAARTAAAKPEIEVVVEPRRVELGGMVTVQFTVHPGTGQRGRFEDPDYGGFDLVGTGRRNQAAVVKGRYGQVVVLTRQLRPRRAGVLVIGPATYRDRSGTARSRPVNVRVEAPRAAPVPPTAALEQEVALVAEAEPASPVPGEPVRLTFTLYRQVEARRPRLEEPDLTGFWQEDLEEPRELRWQQRSVAGRRYSAARLAEYLLYPLSPGTVTVPPVPVHVEVPVVRDTRRGRARFWERRTHRSNPVTLEVRPFPPGAPRGFSEAVGRFELAAALDRTEVRVGEPVTLTLTLSGTGNFRHFSLRPPSLPDGLRAHPPQGEDKLKVGPDGLQGKKRLEQILVPERAGRFELPAAGFAYYDPDAGDYAVAGTRPLRLRAEPRPGGAPVAGRPLVATGRQEATIEAPALRPLHTDPVLRPRRRRPDPPWSSGLFWLALLLPPLVLGGLVAFERVRSRRVRTEDQRVMRRALRRARRRLKDAEDYLREGRASQVYGEIARTLIGYVDDRTCGRTAGLTIGELGSRLEAAGYPVSQVREVLQELEHCDQARFSAAGASQEEMRASLGRVRALLKRLDRHEPAVGRREGA